MNTFSRFLLSLAIILPSVMGAQVDAELLKEVFHEKLIANKKLPELEPHNTNRASEEYKMTANANSSVMEGEPTIAINPVNPDNIVVSFMSFQNNTLSLPIYVSFDGGETWTLSAFNTLDHYNSDPSRTSAPVAGGGDPILEFDEDGNLYFLWIYLGIESGFNGLWHNFWAESTDGGLSFSTRSNGKDVWNYGEINLLTNTLGNTGDGIFDRHWLAIDRSEGPYSGSLYVAGLFISNNMTPLGSGGMVLKIKRSNSSEFEYRHIPLSTTENAQFANIKVDEAGNVHIVYGNIDNETIVHQMSTDGGETFSSPTTLGNFEWKVAGGRSIHDRENAAPNMALTPSGSLVVSWTNRTAPAESYIVRSTDNGQTWGSPTRINDLINPDDYDGAIWPMLAAEGSEMTLFFYALDGKRADYAALFSENNGQSFSNFEVISGGSTDFATYPINNQFRETFFGDYNNAIQSENKAYVVFSDGRAAQGPKVYLAITNRETTNTTITSFEDERLKVSPNPANGPWVINWDADMNSEGNLHIIDASGRLIAAKLVDISSGTNEWKGWIELTQGHYVVQMVVGQQTVVCPLIIR